jgi:glutamate-5-semialdehyde dehydrogenase
MIHRDDLGAAGQLETHERSTRTPEEPMHRRRWPLGQQARAAARTGPRQRAPQKNRGAAGRCRAIRAQKATILAANARDMAAARRRPVRRAARPAALDAEARRGHGAGIEAVAALPDPVGTVIAEWTRPNGLRIQRVRVPLGVIGIIYESRPNVTADAGALCLKSGNAVILRGGRRASTPVARSTPRSSRACAPAGLPEAAIQMVPTADRAAVGHLLGTCRRHRRDRAPRRQEPDRPRAGRKRACR